MATPTAYMIRYTHAEDAYGERAETVELTDSPSAYAAYNFEAEVTELYSLSEVLTSVDAGAEALHRHYFPDDKGRWETCQQEYKESRREDVRIILRAILNPVLKPVAAENS